MAEPAGSQRATVPHPSLEHPFAPGDLLLGRFRIVREVAQGGMGIVYEAIDERLERRIALKCAKLAFRGQLPREVRSATEISHPNVCNIFEIHTTKTQFGEIDFLTMEFLDGETLSARLRRGGLSKDEAIAIVRQICAGLEAAHQEGVVHGDLKTSNVILSPRAPDHSKQAVITDFGLAHRPDAVPGTVFAGELGGTRGYMAPELMRGEPASAASDIYAMGIVLSEIFAACGPAILRDEPTAVTMTMPTGSPKPGLPIALKPAGKKTRWQRVIGGCLQEQPENRFASASQIARALEPPHRARAIVLVLAILAFALVVAAVTYWRTTAPARSVKLALAPLDAGEVPNSLKIAQDIAELLKSLRGDAATGFEFSQPARATQTLHVAMSPDASSADPAGLYNVRARITDAKTGSDLRGWEATYKKDELGYLPAGLAGFVTMALQLPPVAPSTNPAAEADLKFGLQEVRRPSGADQALSLLTKAVSEDRASPLTYAALAEAQWRKFVSDNNPAWLDAATESLRKAELRNMDLAPVHRIAGLLQAYRGRYDQAVTSYRRAIQLDATNGDGYRRLGMVYQKNKQMDEAGTAYQKAVAVEPSDFRNHQQLAALEDAESNFAEAIRHLKDAVALAPAEAELHRQLGTEYQSVGNFAEAEKEARRALELHDGPKALQSLGLALLYQSRYKEALPYLEQSTRAGNPEYLWYSNLSVAYRHLGMLKQSKKAIEDGIRLANMSLGFNRNDASARSVLAFFRARNGQPDLAATEIQQALQQAPLTSQEWFYAAVTYEALGRRADTLNVLKSASPQAIALLNRWPDVADLHRDAQFQQMLSKQPAR